MKKESSQLVLFPRRESVATVFFGSSTPTFQPYRLDSVSINLVPWLQSVIFVPSLVLSLVSKGIIRVHSRFELSALIRHIRLIRGLPRFNGSTL